MLSQCNARPIQRYTFDIHRKSYRSAIPVQCKADTAVHVVWCTPHVPLLDVRYRSCETNSPKPNFHNDSPGNAGLGAATIIIKYGGILDPLSPKPFGKPWFLSVSNVCFIFWSTLSTFRYACGGDRWEKFPALTTCITESAWVYHKVSYAMYSTMHSYVWICAWTHACSAVWHVHDHVSEHSRIVLGALQDFAARVIVHGLMYVIVQYKSCTCSYKVTYSSQYCRSRGQQRTVSKYPELGSIEDIRPTSSSFQFFPGEPDPLKGRPRKSITTTSWAYHWVVPLPFILLCPWAPTDVLFYQGTANSGSIMVLLARVCFIFILCDWGSHPLFGVG